MNGATPPAPSRLVQTAAVVLLLQGLAPALFLGDMPWVPWVLAASFGSWGLLAWALWHGKRWAWRAAAIFTAPQALAISLPWFSWEAFLGLRFGFGIEPRLDLLKAPIFSFWTIGAMARFGLLQSNPATAAEFGSHHSFLCLNIPPALVLALLLAIKRRRDREALQPPPLPHGGLELTPGTE